jgi:hypothetical protein
VTLLPHTEPAPEHSLLTDVEIDQLDTATPSTWTDDQWRIFCDMVQQKNAETGMDVSQEICEQVYCIDADLYRRNLEKLQKSRAQKVVAIEESVRTDVQKIVIKEDPESARQKTFVLALNLQLGLRCVDYQSARHVVAERMSIQLAYCRPQDLDRPFADLIASLLDTFHPSEHGRVQGFLADAIKKSERRRTANSFDHRSNVKTEQIGKSPKKKNCNYFLRKHCLPSVFALATKLQQNGAVNILKATQEEVKGFAYEKLKELVNSYDSSIHGSFWEWAEGQMTEYLTSKMQGEIQEPVQEKRTQKVRVVERETLDPVVILEQQFSRYEQSGWKRYPQFQTMFIEWLQNQMPEEAIDSYRDALWVVVRLYKEKVIQKIADAIKEHPTINAGLFIRSGFFGLISGADRYNPNGDTDPEEFLLNGVEFSLKKNY